ncbi:MAG TPA: NAD(P)/FAD-dependent oxidoreductase [Flavobacteriaceae bacterium]|nr:NAD(P)/FAD-dependent oxidoreductase [Flavobacteriaceae bacterium]HIN99440.1 NAD(P)/FAD-dependent oxidoreductase [Flavobacteriaceae bacterium]
MPTPKLDVLIIGAGPSGCVAAAYLQKKGLSIRVVEKNKFPRFVIGESLLPRCMEHFEEVGLLAALQKQGFEKKFGARFIKGDAVCHFDFAESFTDGWTWTWQVPRDHFDKTLTDYLEANGVPISFETTVTAVTFANDGSSRTTVCSTDGSEEIIEASFIIDASGHGRVLPRLLSLETAPRIEAHSSIFTHVEDVNRPDGVEGTLITFDVISTETWLWVIPFSNGKCSIGYVGPTEYLASFKGTPTEKLQQMMQLSDHYYARFKGCDYLFEPITLKNVSKSVTKLFGKGFALTGNSAEFLDPVFSSGVTFATESGLRAAKLIAKQHAGERVDWQTEYADYILNGVDVFGTYVKEWYTGNLQKIFFQGTGNPEIKRQICSVLAGYVWDESNPFVKNHDRLVKTLARVIDLENTKQT